MWYVLKRHWWFVPGTLTLDVINAQTHFLLSLKSPPIVDSHNDQFCLQQVQAWITKK